MPQEDVVVSVAAEEVVSAVAEVVDSEVDEVVSFQFCMVNVSNLIYVHRLPARTTR